MSQSSYMRACCFLKVLFCIAAKTITKIDAHYTPSEGDTKRTYRIKRFREIMSEGQLWAPPGSKELNFTMTLLTRQRYAVSVFSQFFLIHRRYFEEGHPERREKAGKQEQVARQEQAG